MPRKDVIASGKFLSYIMLDGYEMVERINCSGVVCILPVTADGEVIFVEQYRPAIQSRTIELPAGLVNDKGESESMEVAARRELLEETGYEAAELTEIEHLPTSQGMTSETVRLYLARDVVRRGEGGGDEEEDIAVHVVPLKEVDQFIARQKAKGCMVDPKIYAGLYMLQRNP